MKNQHEHTHGCAHCSCNNPVLEILKEELFSAENLTKINPGSGKATHEKPQTLMISGGIIRPMIGGSTETVESIGIADGNVVITGQEADVKDYMEKNHPGYQKGN